VRSRTSPLGLNALNFFMAAAQTGFGPFLSVYLTVEKWDQTAIGFALSISTVAAIVTRLPAGWLVDAIHAKRAPIAAALVLLGMSALMIAAWPAVVPVWLALVLHGFSGSILVPAIAAVTLSICGQNAFGERLGTNARYASLGNAAAAGLLGVAATFSERSVFLLTAAIVVPALLALHWIEPHQVEAEKDHPALLHPKVRKKRGARPWHIFIRRHLHVFAVCVVLFHLSNAAMLSLALNELAMRGREAGWVISASVVVPQVLVALLSPWTGRKAQSWGRRPLLLIGFAAVPLRALLFASLPGGPLLVFFELLDGVSATVFGIMLPLIAADLTRRTGYLNLAIGSLGLAASLGATLSTAMAGWIADHVSPQAAFLALAAAGAASVLLIWFDMPETRPSSRRPVAVHA
jgi:MFS family permease